MSPFPEVTNAIGALGSLALAIAALLIIIGAPVIVVLAIRALWYRHIYVGRSAELEKLIFQLHRIASALETQQPVAKHTDKSSSPSETRPISLSMFGR